MAHSLTADQALANSSASSSLMHQGHTSAFSDNPLLCMHQQAMDFSSHIGSVHVRFQKNYIPF